MTTKPGKLAVPLFWTILILLIAFLYRADLINGTDEIDAKDAAFTIKDSKFKRTLKEHGVLPANSSDRPVYPMASTPGLPFRFDLQNIEMDRLVQSRGHHMNPMMEKWTDTSLSVDGGPAIHALLRVRGAGSSSYDKKSLNVKLYSLLSAADDLRLRRFFLINLVDDEYGFKHRFSYLLLAQLGLFPSYNQFVRVFLNDAPFGLYLLVERPKNAILRTRSDVVSIFRKRYFDYYDAKFIAQEIEGEHLIERLAEIHSINDPTRQAQEYERYMSMDEYMTWLGFNSLVQNADTVDELFAYETRRSNETLGKMHFMAWDYDNLQEKPSHPKFTVRNPYLWAAENTFDHDIADNELLYDRFKSILRDLLENKITKEMIANTLSRVRYELASIDELIYGEDLETIRVKREKEMGAFESRLFERHDYLLDRLNRDSQTE